MSRDAPASSWRRVFRVFKGDARSLGAYAALVSRRTDVLQNELAVRADRLRPADYVMRPDVLGAARLTRYSFSRTMLRRAVAEGWAAARIKQRLDDDGCGESIYRLRTGSHEFHFVAFTTTIDESAHTDRVIADRWEIAAALVDGDLDEDLMAILRTEVPRQERGRLNSRVLVLTRGNRSVRFFNSLVGDLAAGRQPDPEGVGDAGYILRSTAFYANGKFGMRSFEGYGDDHPLRVPYRAQLVAAWLFRELGYDMVEHCARATGGPAAVGFDSRWRRFFGLGNATGLGLVPYALKHPRVVDAWVGVREIALADVRLKDGSPELSAGLKSWITRARQHFASGSNDDCSPFLNSQALVPVLDEIESAWKNCIDLDQPYNALYQWAEKQGPETAELVVSLLIELHDIDDDLVDECFLVDERTELDPVTTVDDLRSLVAERFDWLVELDLNDEEADAFWWVVSDNNEEPRRVLHTHLAPDGQDVAIDIALRVWRLAETLKGRNGSEPAGAFLINHPEHLAAVQRLTASDRRYGELRDNACAIGYLPLQIQRFQLAQYGMDEFKPKDTDWLRVTLLQGAPRLADLGPGLTDDWALPIRPERTRSR